MSKRVGVIGGGISGLCVAYGLKRAGVDVSLFEKNLSVGGNIRTEIHDGFLIEHGPNSTLASRELLYLLSDLGLVNEICRPRSASKKRYILRDGRLRQLPSRIVGLIGSNTFSAGAKIRLLKESFIRTRTADNESVAAFFERRFGREIVDYAVDPFVSGIYAGDPGKLSIKYAFPRLVELEKTFGSVTRGLLFGRDDPSTKLPKGIPRSIAFKNGMQTLADKLYESIRANVVLGSAVEEIASGDSGEHVVRTNQGETRFDALIISTPSHAAAQMIGRLDSRLAGQLDQIYYAPVAVVFTAFRSDQVRFDPDGFGFLVPKVEGRQILGSLWTSSVFENRTPQERNYHLFTTFIGGSRNGELAGRDDEELIQITLSELDSVLGIEGEPSFTAVKKWQKAIPQYNIGYEKVEEAIEEFRKNNPTIFFCSNFYKGISVSDCVKNAAATTKQVLDVLNS